MKPKLIVEQKITALANQYRVFAVGENQEKGELVAFAHQKRLAFKEKVIFYADEKKSQEVFSFRAEKVMDVHGRFLVEAKDAVLVGAFRKDFKKSLLSSTWYILDKDNKPAITVTESSQALAIIRRFAGFIPIVGGVVEILTGFFKYHFIFNDVQGNEVGRYQKIALFRDHYRLLIDDQNYNQQDWRVLASVAVALDALQSR